MAIEVFNRYEHKYLINQSQYEKIIEILNEHMELDYYNENGAFYTISNIYYDTADNFIIRASMSKPVFKEKLRLRCYGAPDLNSQVFLEIKRKVNGIVNKRRTSIELLQAYEFIKSKKPLEIMPYMNLQVVKEIQYFLSIYDVSPKVFIAYDRLAYFEKNNPDLRISFDKNIRTRRNELFLEKGDKGDTILPDGHYLMEVKTSIAKPTWLTKVLSELQIYKISFSKYAEEYRRQIKNGYAV